MSEDRLTSRDLQRAQQRAAYVEAQKKAMKQKRDDEDRLTSRDLQRAQQRATYIKAQKEAMKQNRGRITQRDIETFQNDRTKPLPREAYEQVDQELTYPDEVEGKKSGGMIKCKGGRKAIGGTKFTGVK
jgi:YD repeat-containing protein